MRVKNLGQLKMYSPYCSHCRKTGFKEAAILTDVNRNASNKITRGAWFNMLALIFYTRMGHNIKVIKGHENLN